MFTAHQRILRKSSWVHYGAGWEEWWEGRRLRKECTMGNPRKNLNLKAMCSTSQLQAGRHMDKLNLGQLIAVSKMGEKHAREQRIPATRLSD